MTTSTTALYRSIHAQPEAVRSLLNDSESPTRAAEELAGSSRVFLSGIGTSFHAAMVGEYILRFVGVDAWAVRSFEFVNYPRPLRPDDGVIVISHRGSKLHGNLAVQRVIESGVYAIGITGKQTKMQGLHTIVETVDQDPSSTHSISYIGTMTRLTQIAVALAQHTGKTEQAQRLEQSLKNIPSLMERILSREDEVRQVADDAVAHQRRLYFVGAGPNAATAPEGALKAKEASYVTTEGFELEQAIHGPQVAFETEDVVIPISVPGPAQARMKDFLLAMNEIGSRVWLIGEDPDTQINTLFEREGWSQFPLGTPEEMQNLPEVLTPVLAALPVQLLADFLAAARGTDADSFRKDHEAYNRAGERFRI